MNRQKYPRTFNFPWSGSNSSDDVWWKDSSNFEGKEVVILEKIDGENTNIYPDGFVHARSLDTAHHPSRSWVKQYASTFAYDIPQGWKICGENVFAWHSIFYTDLPTYFFVFAIVNEQNQCLSWQEVEEWCCILKLHTVPVIYRGIWDEKKVRSLWQGQGAFPTYQVTRDLEMPKFPEDFAPCEAEGYVARLASSFHIKTFSQNVAKMVRKNHVQTDQNWMLRPVLPNLLKT